MIHELNYIGYSKWRLFSINEAECIRWSGADVAFVIQFDVDFLKFIWTVA